MPYGDNQIHDTVMFAYDVPMSRTVMPHAMNVLKERNRRVMMMHPEGNYCTVNKLMNKIRFRSEDLNLAKTKHTGDYNSSMSLTSFAGRFYVFF